MLSVKGKELCALLRLVLQNKDEFVCTMLALTYKQKKPDENYQKMIDFIEKNPNVTNEDIMNKQDEILQNSN